MNILTIILCIIIFIQFSYIIFLYFKYRKKCQLQFVIKDDTTALENFYCMSLGKPFKDMSGIKSYHIKNSKNPAPAVRSEKPEPTPAPPDKKQ